MMGTFMLSWLGDGKHNGISWEPQPPHPWWVERRDSWRGAGKGSHGGAGGVRVEGLIKNDMSRKGFARLVRQEGVDATFHFDISPFSSNGNSLSFSESVFSDDKGEGNCQEVLKCYHYHDRRWVSGRLVVGRAAERPRSGFSRRHDLKARSGFSVAEYFYRSVSAH